MKKRLTALILALALAATLLPWAAAAGEEAGEVARVRPAKALRPAEDVCLNEGDRPDAGLLEAPDYEGARVALRQCLLNYGDVINLSAYHIPATEAGMGEVSSYIFYRYGEAFHFTGGGQYSGSGGYVVLYYPQYSMNEAEYRAAKVEYDQKLQDILDLVPQNVSPLEQVLFVHDYLTANYSYDLSEDPNYDAYHFLKSKIGVCQGYTLTFSALMDKLGIPVSYVDSDWLIHIWNLVELDGKWYHIDVTWDDPSIYGSDTLGASCHDNFLLSDEAALAIHAREGILELDPDDPADAEYVQGLYDELKYGVDVKGKCTDKSYETSIYARADSPFLYVPGDEAWYYINAGKRDAGLYRWYPGTEENDGMGEQLWDYSGRSGFVTPLVEYRGCLFFSDPDGVYRYEISTNNHRTLRNMATASAPEGAHFAGLKISDSGVLTYKFTDESTGQLTNIMPWHIVENRREEELFSYYYDFGAVGFRMPENGGWVLCAWYDPATGKMVKVAGLNADGYVGKAVAWKDYTCVVFALRGDDTARPLGEKTVLHQGKAD